MLTKGTHHRAKETNLSDEFPLNGNSSLEIKKRMN
jgi:hypothetical protein